MLNKTDLNKAALSMLLTGVFTFALALVACQESNKDYTEKDDSKDVVLLKIESGELLSKAVCTDKLQVYSILSNAKNPLKVESKDNKYYYTNFIFKIYLLPDKSFTGSLVSKVFDTHSGAPIHEAKTKTLNGVWVEKEGTIDLLGLGKIRKVKVEANSSETENKADSSTSKIELFISSTDDSSLVKKATQLFVDQAAKGPFEQDVADICQPVH